VAVGIVGFGAFKIGQVDGFCLSLLISVLSSRSVHRTLGDSGNRGSWLWAFCLYCHVLILEARAGFSDGSFVSGRVA
jgi:hypothetical protein